MSGVMLYASSKVIPLTISLIMEVLAIALAQP